MFPVNSSNADFQQSTPSSKLSISSSGSSNIVNSTGNLLHDVPVKSEYVSTLNTIGIDSQPTNSSVVETTTGLKEIVGFY